MPPPISRSALYAGGVELRASAVRLFAIAFLSLWLCGWLVGELLVLGVLLTSLASLAGVDLPALVGIELNFADGAIPWFVSLFLLVWLTFWTFGGLTAMRQLWQLLVSREHVRIEAGELVVERARGPLRQRSAVDVMSITDVVEEKGTISISTGGRSRPLVIAGSREDQKALAQALREAVGLGRRPEAADSRDAG